MRSAVSPAHAGVEASPPPPTRPASCRPCACGVEAGCAAPSRTAARRPRVCGGRGEFVAEAITTRRPVSVVVFLPERLTLTRRAGIEDAWFIFNPRRLSLPVLAVTVRRPGEPQCVSPAYAGVHTDLRLTLSWSGIR